jgi:citrate lyase subunit beta/citryl-CoA lyase
VVEAMAPTADEIELAANLIESARDAEWAPVSYKGQLHDRASYRFFWQVLERAHQTGRALPPAVQGYFVDLACAP